ncbi:MAG TPA: ATP synthase F0 subunit C [Deltaproteobacteria bacterium]|nr:ATP synthase F0 subunit C [Deltaproteobacteria bacterium]
MKRIFVVMMFLGVFIVSTYGVAMAAEEAKGLEASVKQMVALAAGFGVAIAAFGGALGQSRSITSALDGIARNPGASGKIVTPMIIGLAMIESLVIYSLVVSLLLIFKL